jgi:hypothetical protein
VENLLVWIALGVVSGARLDYVVQNHLSSYVHEPWRILTIWEGGLAYFGGLFRAILAGFLYCRTRNISFRKVADLFAPAIPVGSAIGRIVVGWTAWTMAPPHHCVRRCIHEIQPATLPWMVSHAIQINLMNSWGTW